VVLIAIEREVSFSVQNHVAGDDDLSFGYDRGGAVAIEGVGSGALGYGSADALLGAGKNRTLNRAFAIKARPKIARASGAEAATEARHSVLDALTRDEPTRTSDAAARIVSAERAVFSGRMAAHAFNARVYSALVIVIAVLRALALRHSTCASGPSRSAASTFAAAFTAPNGQHHAQCEDT
jgi:hypothetical protein